MDTNQQTQCKHIKVKFNGFWDGRDESGNPTGGPNAKCLDCQKELYLTWPEWNQIPEENREGSDKIKKMEKNLAN